MDPTACLACEYQSLANWLEFSRSHIKNTFPVPIGSFNFFLKREISSINMTRQIHNNELIKVSQWQTRCNGYKLYEQKAIVNAITYVSEVLNNN